MLNGSFLRLQREFMDSCTAIYNTKKAVNMNVLCNCMIYPLSFIAISSVIIVSQISMWGVRLLQSKFDRKIEFHSLLSRLNSELILKSVLCIVRSSLLVIGSERWHMLMSCAGWLIRALTHVYFMCRMIDQSVNAMCRMIDQPAWSSSRSATFWSMSGFYGDLKLTDQPIHRGKRRLIYKFRCPWDLPCNYR